MRRTRDDSSRRRGVESCGGNPETGRTPGERVAYSLTAGVRGTGDGHGNAWNSNYVTAIQDVRGVRDKKKNGIGIAENEPMYTLDGTSQHGVHIASPLAASAGHHGHSSPGRVIATHGVRRLTPLECERLQGFPDGWTEGQSDSHRYRQLGNAVPVPVAEWIGHRLVAIDAPFFAQGSATPAQHNVAPTR